MGRYTLVYHTIAYHYVVRDLKVTQTATTVLQDGLFALEHLMLFFCITKQSSRRFNKLSDEPGQLGVKAEDLQQADVHQWCLRTLLGIKWYHIVSNDEVRHQTNQPLFTEIIQARRLTLFGHIARMDDNVDAKQILTSSPSVYWKRPPGQPRMTWMKTKRPRLPRAVMDRRSRPGLEPTTLEAVGNQWRYALVVVQAGEEEDVVWLSFASHNIAPCVFDR